MKTVSMVSLGCPKNLVDSESILGRLAEAGWRFTPRLEGAGLVILNTCGFIESARSEAFQMIQELTSLKKRKRIGRLVVCGCLIRAVGESLVKGFPEIDGWYGPSDEARLVEEANRSLRKPGPVPFYASAERHYTFHESNRLLLTLPHTAYLKIAEGCDRFCSYCAIPSIRGRFTSKPLGDIQDEAKMLADSGVRELILIAQETTFWGNDLYGQPRLAELVASLKEMNEFAWIRILYTYPLFFGDDLINLIGFNRTGKGGTAVLPYIDIPLQHCNDRILKLMNRKVGKTEIEELLTRLREQIQDLVLRTTFITGFPGETDAEFEELVQFAEKWRFERAGVFDYSAEPGTAAARLDGRLSADIKDARYRRLYETVSSIVRETTEAKKGKQLDVLIDTPVLNEDGSEAENFFIGRTFADSPDIDPVVYVTGEGLNSGDFCSAEVVDVQDVDLVAAQL